MHETTHASYALVDQWLVEDLPPQAEYDGLRAELLYYAHAYKRTGANSASAEVKPSSRPYLTRLFYELREGAPWESAVPVFGLAELFNISAHQMNLAFDHKGACRSAEKRERNQSISAFLSLAKTHRLVERYLTGDRLCAAQRLIADCTREIYTGQYLDLSVLQSARLGALPPEEFTRLYLDRCACMGGGTYEICALGSIAAGHSEQETALVREFLRALGTAAQVLNDLNDMKSLLDTPPTLPSDLVEGKLTNPIYHLLATAEGRKAMEISEPEARAAHLRAVLGRLCLKTITMQLLRQRVWKKIQYQKRRLIQSFGGPASQFFSFTSHFVFGSRYYPEANDRCTTGRDAV